MAESTTLVPVKLGRRRRDRAAPAARHKTHALPQAGAARDRTMCGRLARGATLDEGTPTCKRCVQAIGRAIAAGVDVSVVSGDGIITVHGLELTAEVT